MKVVSDLFLRSLKMIICVWSLSCFAQTTEYKWPFTCYWEGRLKGISDLRENISTEKFDDGTIENFLSRYKATPENNVLLDDLNKYLIQDLHLCSEQNQHCQNSLSKKFVISARKRFYLDDTAFSTLYNDLKNQDKKKYVKLISLPSYEQALNVLRAKYIENTKHSPVQETVFDYKWKEFYLKINGVYLSPRAKLYNQYNTYQIKQLAKIMDETMKNMNAQNIAITVDENGDGKAERSYDLPIPEKYRMALRLLNLEKQRLVKEGILMTVPQNIDLLTAAFESGLIDGEILQELVNMKELKVKNFDRYKVYKQMLVRIGKSAVTAIPVAGPILIIPIVVIESYIELRKNNNVSEASHIF